MNTQISHVGVLSADSTRPAPQPALVVQFPEIPPAMSLGDQAHELRIQAEGLLMHANMLDFERTGQVRHRIKARRHLVAMQALIAARSPECRAAMERAVGGCGHA
ncbi:hypothetical protein [Comamonas terrae]|uniref:Uncharacterized protein n=1 Tax=Comamonas terrae TaxID=673548 RepID=A0ABW5UQU1_9BURK|nr:hypothetical protein [Comamonas terrae]